MALHDPMEQIIAEALTRAGIEFVTDEGGGNPAGLDFYLPAADLHIEVKRFHSPRVADQMSRAPNVICAQGEAAVNWLAKLIATPLAEGGVPGEQEDSSSRDHAPAPGSALDPADEAQMALCHLDFITNLPGVHPHRAASIRQALERLATFSDATLCIACQGRLRVGDRYYADASGGFIHADCCGPERESYTGANGEPLGPDESIPAPSIWEDEPSRPERSETSGGGES